MTKFFLGFAWVCDKRNAYLHVITRGFPRVHFLKDRSFTILKLGIEIISYRILYVLIDSIKYGIGLFCTKKYGPGGYGKYMCRSSLR
jgi:hypothetical protein